MTDTLFSATPVATIPLDRLTLPTDNLGPIDPDVVEQLVASIKAIGVLEPIRIVELVDGLYEIHDGRHRYLAAGEAGLTEIPYVISEFVDESERWLSMLAGHLHRRNVDPIAEGAAYARLVELGATQHELADKVGRSQSHISKRIALATLPAPALEAVAEGRLTIVGAETMARISDPKKVAELAKGSGQIQDWKITEVLKDEERQASIDKLRQEQTDAGRTEVVGEYWKGYSTAEADEATHFFISNYGSIALLAVKPDGDDDTAGDKPKKQRETAAEKKERLAEEAADAAWEQMLAERTEFAKGQLAEKVDPKAAQDLLATWVAMWFTDDDTYFGVETIVVADLIGLTVPTTDDDGNTLAGWQLGEAASDVCADFAALSGANALKVAVAGVLSSALQQLRSYRHRTGGGVPKDLASAFTWFSTLGYLPTPADLDLIDRLTTPAEAVGE